MSKEEIAWRKILGRLQKCRCVCSMNADGYCYNGKLYSFKDVETRLNDAVILCTFKKLRDAIIFTVDEEL